MIKHGQGQKGPFTLQEPSSRARLCLQVSEVARDMGESSAL